MSIRRRLGEQRQREGKGEGTRRGGGNPEVVAESRPADAQVGMCWLRIGVRYETPLMLPQKKFSGTLGLVTRVVMDRRVSPSPAAATAV